MILIRQENDKFQLDRIYPFKK